MLTITPPLQMKKQPQHNRTTGWLSTRQWKGKLGLHTGLFHPEPAGITRALPASLVVFVRLLSVVALGTTVAKTANSINLAPRTPVVP